MSDAGRSTMARALGVAPWGLYAVCAALLVWFRMPWVDEAWVSGPAVTLLREGRMLEVGGPLPHEMTREAPLLESYGAVLAGWFGLLGVDLLRGRLLTVLIGAAYLALTMLALRDSGVARHVRTVVLWLLAPSYFFLVTSTWIRPDISSLTLCLLAGIAAARWADGRGTRWLLLAHAAAVVATTWHLMAGCVGIALWIATLGGVRRPGRGELAAFAAPYGAALAITGVVYAGRLDAVAYSFSRGFSGEIVGHGGGIPGAVLRWAGQGRWTAVLVMLAVVAVVAIGPWAFARDRRTPSAWTLALVAWGAAVAWFATTAIGDNYHAVWITPALTLGAAAAWRADGTLARVRLPLLAAPAALAVLGLVLVGRSVRDDLRSVFEADLARLDAEHGLRSATLTGPREIQWHYDFALGQRRHFADGHRPDWFLVLRTRHAPDPVVRPSGIAYRLVDRGDAFALYRRSD